MKVIKTLKYGHDDYIIIEDTEGSMDLKYIAKMRDGGGLGAGNRPYDAVTSLLINLTKESDRIRAALCESIWKKEKGWFND